MGSSGSMYPSLSELQEFCEGPTGMVRRCVRLPPLRGLPEVALWVAESRYPFLPGQTCCNGTGVSSNSEFARRLALTEAVERYSAFSPHGQEHSIRHAPFSQVADIAVSPGRFAYLSDAQIREHSRLTAPSSYEFLDWSWAYSLTRDTPVLIPAATTYLMFLRTRPPGFLPFWTTTGCAAHATMEGAQLIGLCEVFERDAVAIAWHNQLSLTRVIPNGTPTELLISRVAAAGYGIIELYSVPTDLPFPVIMAVCTSEDDASIIALGTACSPDPLEAALKACYEVIQNLYVRVLDSGSNSPGPTTACVDVAPIMAFWLSMPDGHVYLRDLINCGRGSDGVDLQNTVKQLAVQGFEVLYKDLSSTITSLSGLAVLRIIVPEAVDLIPDSRFLPFGKRRMFDAPSNMGAGRPMPRETDLVQKMFPL